MGLTILGIILTLLISGLWFRKLKREGKEIKWYWYVILPHEWLFLRITLVALVIATTVLAFRHFPRKLRKTEKLLKNIVAAAEEYQNDTGIYPESIDELIRNNPLRKNWVQDFWGTEVRIESSENMFRITSAASDRIFDSSDDLVLEIKE